MPGYNSKVLSSAVEFIPRKLRTPLHLSSGTITDVLEARARVEIETGGRRAIGHGAIYLSDIWAWPDNAVPHETREAELQQLCQTLADEITEAVGPDACHPLELGLRLAEFARRRSLRHSVPELARILCASPFDAAIHDAAGIARERSSFALYDGDDPIPSADALFGPGGACRAVRETLRSTPVRELPSWYVLGPRDVCDGNLECMLRARGDRRFKLKILARDLLADARWVADIHQWLVERATPHPRLLIDANEAIAGVDEVLEFLQYLRYESPEAFEAIDYLEQPTSRDIVATPLDWRLVTEWKPVLLDEGLTRLELLPEAARQGWSGLALKTCKGHSLCLLAAAWARRHGLSIALQDLTNPGYALVHAALFAAHIPTINGVELNSAQFTPDANREWLPHRADLIVPRDGLHRLCGETPPGLGSVWRTA